MITIDEAKQIVRTQYMERNPRRNEAQAFIADHETQAYEWGWVFCVVPGPGYRGRGFCTTVLVDKSNGNTRQCPFPNALVVELAAQDLVAMRT